MTKDNGAPAAQDGLSQAEPEVSALRASIPSENFTDAECSFCGVQNAPGLNIYFVEGNGGVVICEVCLLAGLSKITEAKQDDWHTRLAEQAPGDDQ